MPRRSRPFPEWWGWRQPAGVQTRAFCLFANGRPRRRQAARSSRRLHSCRRGGGPPPYRAGPTRGHGPPGAGPLARSRTDRTPRGLSSAAPAGSARSGIPMLLVGYRMFAAGVNNHPRMAGQRWLNPLRPRRGCARPGGEGDQDWAVGTLVTTPQLAAGGSGFRRLGGGGQVDSAFVFVTPPVGARTGCVVSLRVAGRPEDGGKVADMEQVWRRSRAERARHGRDVRPGWRVARTGESVRSRARISVDSAEFPVERPWGIRRAGTSA